MTKNVRPFETETHDLSLAVWSSLRIFKEFSKSANVYIGNVSVERCKKMEGERAGTVRLYVD